MAPSRIARLPEYLKEEAFCFSIKDRVLSQYCHNCLKGVSVIVLAFDDINDLRRCSGCHKVAYCNKECMNADWKLHRTECKAYKELGNSPTVLDESMRLMQRMAYKWSKGQFGEVKLEDGSYRSLLTLDGHFDETHMEAKRYIQDYKRFFKKQIVDDETLLRIYSIMCMNSFSMENQAGGPIALMLCIQLSQAKHSCRPNTRVTALQRQAILAATGKFIPPSLKETTVSFIDDLMIREQRRLALWNRYQIICECEGCLDEERNREMESWKCEVCMTGWMPNTDPTKCRVCSWEASPKFIKTCQKAERMAKALAAVECDVSVRNVRVATDFLSMYKNHLTTFNVLRLPALKICNHYAVRNENTERLIDLSEQILHIQSKYLGFDDIQVCWLQYTMANIYKHLQQRGPMVELLSNARRVFQLTYGPLAEIVVHCNLLLLENPIKCIKEKRLPRAASDTNEEE